MKLARSCASPANSLAAASISGPSGGARLERHRFKTYVRGLDDALGGGIPEGHVILVSGAPGTMKSSLAFAILYENVLREGRKAAYVTLGPSKEALLEQMASLGLADAAALERLSLLDMGNIRKNLNVLQSRGTWLEIFKMYCTNVMKSDPISMLVIDSLDVLETMAKLPDRRSDLYFLFEWLRDLGPLTFLVSERPIDPATASGVPDEAYLADGILQLDQAAAADGSVRRRLRVMKMRASRHDPDFLPLTWVDGGFAVSRDSATTAPASVP